MKNDSTGKNNIYIYVYDISINFRDPFSFLFGETSENITNHMLRDICQVLNSIFAEDI